MHTPLYDHSFKTIGYMTEQSKFFIPPTLQRIEDLRNEIAAKYGRDSANNVIGQSIGHALERCLQYFEPASNINSEDYHIYYSYAANAAVGIDQIISNDFPEL
jgi:hypothetical protein